MCMGREGTVLHEPYTAANVAAGIVRSGGRVLGVVKSNVEGEPIFRKTVEIGSPEEIKEFILAFSGAEEGA